jgi:methyltransferase (TIGR00027 family)
MRPERASRTAMMVAYMRALADAGVSHVPGFRDPTARVYLNEKWSRRLAKVETQLREGRKSTALTISRAASDMMALRSSVIDDAVRAALGRGIDQLVILGAGLDGRAWRLDELAGVRVFEVDHPATQAFKRAHLAALPPPVADVEFVTVDFGRDSLDAALARGGHDASRPTCWIWEGVVMYLTRENVRATLREVAARSAVGSELIVNYHTVRRRGLVRWVLRLAGEPDRSAFSPEEMAEDLRAAGFEPVEDSGAADWAARYANGPVEMRVGRIMRIAVARRGAP